MSLIMLRNVALSALAVAFSAQTVAAAPQSHHDDPVSFCIVGDNFVQNPSWESGSTEGWQYLFGRNPAQVQDAYDGTHGHVVPANSIHRWASQTLSSMAVGETYEFSFAWEGELPSEASTESSRGCTVAIHHDRINHDTTIASQDYTITKSSGAEWHTAQGSYEVTESDLTLYISSICPGKYEKGLLTRFDNVAVRKRAVCASNGSNTTTTTIAGTAMPTSSSTPSYITSLATVSSFYSTATSSSSASSASSSYPQVSSSPATSKTGTDLYTALTGSTQPTTSQTTSTTIPSSSRIVTSTSTTAHSITTPCETMPLPPLPRCPKLATSQPHSSQVAACLHQAPQTLTPRPLQAPLEVLMEPPIQQSTRASVVRRSPSGLELGTRSGASASLR